MGRIMNLKFRAKLNETVRLHNVMKGCHGLLAHNMR